MGRWFGVPFRWDAFVERYALDVIRKKRGKERFPLSLSDSYADCD